MNGHSDAIEHGIYPEPIDDDWGEWEEYERLNREIDSAFISIGRMDKTLDLMDEIAAEHGSTPSKYVDVEDIF